VQLHLRPTRDIFGPRGLSHMRERACAVIPLSKEELLAAMKELFGENDRVKFDKLLLDTLDAYKSALTGTIQVGSRSAATPTF
jgi:hypothetical protein